LLAKEQQSRNAGCGKAKHDQMDPAVRLHFLTGQAGKLPKSCRPKGPPVTKCTDINDA
jgi:hypothetical protein